MAPHPDPYDPYDPYDLHDDPPYDDPYCLFDLVFNNGYPDLGKPEKFGSGRISDFSGFLDTLPSPDFASNCFLNASVGRFFLFLNLFSLTLLLYLLPWLFLYF